MRHTRSRSRRRRASRSTIWVRMRSSSSAERGRRAERALRADGPAAPRGVDRARIPQPGQRVQVRAGRLAQQPLGGRGFELGQLPDGADAEPVQLLGGHGADAPQPFDRQRQQELLLSLGFDDEQPVGLADRAGDLGEELRARDPDRDGAVRPPREPVHAVAPRPARACPRCAGDRRPRGTPRRSRAPPRAASCRGRSRTRLGWPRSTRPSAAGRPRHPGTARAPAGRPSRCAPRGPSPRSSPPARRRRRR